jgi:hypothetical protein
MFTELFVLSVGLIGVCWVGEVFVIFSAKFGFSLLEERRNSIRNKHASPVHFHFTSTKSKDSRLALSHSITQAKLHTHCTFGNKNHIMLTRPMPNAELNGIIDGG